MTTATERLRIREDLVERARLRGAQRPALERRQACAGHALLLLRARAPQATKEQAQDVALALEPPSLDLLLAVQVATARDRAVRRRALLLSSEERSCAGIA